MDYTDDGRFKRISKDKVKAWIYHSASVVTYNYDLKAKERWYKEWFGDNEDAEWEGKYEIEEMRFSGFKRWRKRPNFGL